jgi:hypothetical protein
MKVACAVLVAATAAAHADPEPNRVLPCRPTLGCTADFAPPGELELELGYQLRRGGGQFQHVAPLFAKLTLAHWLQLQLGEDFTYIAGPPLVRYVDDVTAIAKLHLLDQVGNRPSVALSIGANIPTASQPGYTRTYDLLVTLHGSKDIGKLHLDGVLGLQAFQIDGPVSYQPWAAVAATVPIDERFAVALEPHYYADAAPLAARDAGVMLALVYTVRPDVVIDVAALLVGWDQRSVAGLAGITFAPARLW